MLEIIDIFILIFIYFKFFYQKWIKQDLFIFKTLFYIYLCLVIYVTLIPFHIVIINLSKNPLDYINFVPFRDIRIQYYHGAYKEIILNVIMLIPFGFLLPIIIKTNIFKTVFYTFMTSLTIESIQLLYHLGSNLTHRSCDITDIITNTIGGFIGYIIYLIFKPFINYILKKIKA